MALITQQIYSDGIFHGLPIFPNHAGKKYTAIVTGANGISGSEIVDVLAATPDRWATVWAMSRRPPKSEHGHVKSIAADFLSATPEELAATFKKEGLVQVYIQPPTKESQGIWSNTAELDKSNTKLLSNFLSALTLASLIPKRIILQTGGKHYALHLGPTTIPMREGTPLTRIPHANFYFSQEDLLSVWCSHSQHADINKPSFTITRPGFIIGANSGAAINIAYALGVYASVQKEMNGVLEFPSDVGAWDVNKDLTSARLLAWFSEWAALTEAAAGEALNVVDGSPFSYGEFWPVLAGWYGVPFGIPEIDEGKYTNVAMPMSPPPRGFGPAGVVKIKFSFEEWATRVEVRNAWEAVQEREGLDRAFDPWRSRENLVNVFATLDAEMLGSWARTQTMDKARKMGWTGFVQTHESIKDTLLNMAKLRIVPGL